VKLQNMGIQILTKQGDRAIPKQVIWLQFTPQKGTTIVFYLFYPIRELWNGENRPIYGFWRAVLLSKPNRLSAYRFPKLPISRQYLYKGYFSTNTRPSKYTDSLIQLQSSLPKLPIIANIAYTSSTSSRIIIKGPFHKLQILVFVSN
jgi:hypothetical protein